MKKIIMSAVMVLALVGGSVFASTAQNSNTSGSKSSATMKSGKKRTKKHHKRAKMTSTKKANANSK
ncbi:MAG TPA: hypothetical protein VNI02_03855 [Blastocatellia bacterium]|nr:hypothetical protein [Blastocatellia bacterium]